MKSIVLHGALAEFTGQSEYRVEVSDAREAFSWLFAMFPHARNLFKTQNWNIFYGDPEDKELPMWSLGADEFTIGTSRDEIHIAPEVCGLGGSNGTIKTVVGIIIIAAAVFFSGGTLAGLATAAPGALGAAGATYGTIAYVGAAMALSGIAQMLTPMPDMSAGGTTDRNAADQRPSYLFNGAVNVLEEGGAVPIIYGLHRVGSTVISSGVEIEQIAYVAPIDESGGPAEGDSGGTAESGSGVFNANQDQRSCFTGETTIALANGTFKRIDEIEIGDVVHGMSMDNTVTGIECVALEERRLYSFNNGPRGGFFTDEHPFKIEGRQWGALNMEATYNYHGLTSDEVETLEFGDMIRTLDGPVEFKSFEKYGADPKTKVYNLLLTGDDSDHTYYANRYLAHNRGDN